MLKTPLKAVIFNRELVFIDSFTHSFISPHIIYSFIYHAPCYLFIYLSRPIVSEHESFSLEVALEIRLRWGLLLLILRISIEMAAFEYFSFLKKRPFQSKFAVYSR